MRALVAACAAALLWAAPTCGGLITGNLTVAEGRSTILRVPLEAAGAEYEWRVAGADVVSIAGANRTETYVVLIDLPRGVHPVAFVSYDSRHLEIVSVVSGGGPPDPDPAPPPPPPPPPTPGPTKFGLVNAVRAWAAAHVPPANRPQARALADSFRAVDAAIAAGTLRDAAAILHETREGNGRALGGAREAWMPFFRAMEGELRRHHDSGALRTPADYREAWIEVAVGLEGVR